MYKDDHLHTFAQKYGHLRFPFAPQPPTKFDNQPKSEFERASDKFVRRAIYIDGLHSTYTMIAHYWHLKQLINAKEWRISINQDASINSAPSSERIVCSPFNSIIK
jgi:hypothetical protein